MYADCMIDRSTFQLYYQNNYIYKCKFHIFDTCILHVQALQQLGFTTGDASSHCEQILVKLW